MMARPVRFAVVGTNFVTDWLLTSSKTVPGFELAAVYSRTEAGATEYAEKFGCSQTFTSLEELGKSDAVDAVYIASPTSEHAWQVKLLLEAGKHVLVEKPATSNSVELAEVLAAAKASGCTFMEAMRPLKTPNFTKAKAVLKGLGPVRHFSANFCQLSSRWPKYLASTANGGADPVPNAFLPELSNGALMDLGCYAAYPAVALLGPPDSVSYAPLMLPTGVDGGGTLLLRYKTGVATLVISKCSHSFNKSELQTENGTISIDNLGEWSQITLQVRHNWVLHAAFRLSMLKTWACRRKARRKRRRSRLHHLSQRPPIIFGGSLMPL